MKDEEFNSLKGGEEVWITGYFYSANSIKGLVKKVTYSTDMEERWKFDRKKMFFTKEEAVEAALNDMADKVRELEETVNELKQEAFLRGGGYFS